MDGGSATAQKPYQAYDEVREAFSCILAYLLFGSSVPIIDHET